MVLEQKWVELMPNDGSAKDFMPHGCCCNCKHWSKAALTELGLKHPSGYAVCEAVGYFGDGRTTMNLVDSEGSPFPQLNKLALVVLYTHSCSLYQPMD